jgi:hypothetical protein
MINMCVYPDPKVADLQTKLCRADRAAATSDFLGQGDQPVSIEDAPFLLKGITPQPCTKDTVPSDASGCCCIVSYQSMLRELEALKWPT